MKRKVLSLLLAALMLAALLAACGETPAGPIETPAPSENVPPSDPSESVPATEPESFDGQWVFDHAVELYYAKCFTLDVYKGGYQLASTADGTTLLIVPEGMSVPAEAPEDAIILRQPLGNLLVASTPVTSLINACGALDAVTLTTTDRDDWYIDEVKAAMDAGKITFLGSSKEPDYELLAASGSKLAVYNAMLTEDVAAQFDALGIDVLLDLSSQEEHPLGRVEWVKLYGAMLGRDAEAEAVFDAQAAFIDELAKKEKTGKSVVIFYITSSGTLSTRNAGDYMAKMVELAGGDYALSDVGVGQSGTAKLEYEAFYDKAKDADYVVYIWSMGGRPETLSDFLARADILSELKAAKEGNVWCTTPDYFQIQDTIGVMVNDLRLMMEAGPDVDELTYLWRLK